MRKYDGVTVIDATETTGPLANVPRFKATLTVYAFSYLMDHDHGDLARPQEHAAMAAMRHAGLMACVHFGANPIPFVEPATRLDGEAGQTGTVVAVDRVADEITIQWVPSGEVRRVSAAELSGRLRCGDWKLP